MKIAKNFECFKCGDNVRLKPSVILQEGRTNFIIVGESPALDGWIKSGRAFYNSEGNLQASGRVLARLLSILDLSIDDIYFTECCKCVLKIQNVLQNLLKIASKFLIGNFCNYLAIIFLQWVKCQLKFCLAKKLKDFVTLLAMSIKSK